MTSTTTAPLGGEARGVRRLVVTGELDDAWISAIDTAVTDALRAQAERLELDLTGVTQWTPGAAVAITRCLDAAEALRSGVGVTVASAAGRAALLASLARTTHA